MPALILPPLAIRLKDWPWTLALVVIILLGGTNWTFPLARVIAELLGVGLLVAVLATANITARPRLLAPDWLWIALGALFVVQLVPLPPTVWTALPGRQVAGLADTAVFGAPLWRPFSLDPEATWRSAAMLIPALAVYLAARLGPQARRHALLRAVPIAAALTLGLAFAQEALPDMTWTRPYPRGDYDHAVGLFMNRNHQASFLVMSLPLASAWLLLKTPDRSPDRAGAVFAIVVVMVVVGVLATASRTGAALLVPALAATLLAWMSRKRPATGSRAKVYRERLRAIAPVAALLALLLAGGAIVAWLGGDGVTRVFQRGGVLNDPRFTYWPAVVNAALHYWPLGSGIGTFVSGYQMAEPLESVGILYLNHAHNDYLEILLEAGVPGLVLALVGAWELLLLAGRAWREPVADPTVAAMGRLAAIAVLVPVLHSFTDYPLRTIAISCVAALSAAFLATNRESA